MEPGERPEYTVHTDRYPFTIDRRQLETILKAGGAVANPPEPSSTAPPRAPMPVRTGRGHLPDQLQWDGVLLLAEAVPRLWPELAEAIHDYIRNIGRLHLRKPNPGAPGGDRVVLVIKGDDEKEAPKDDDVQEEWDELQPPYKTLNPHPGEGLLRRLGKLTKNGPYQLVFRRVNDFGARWEAVLTDQFVGLDDDLFDYESSCYGSPPRQRFGQRMISDDYRQSDREAVAYNLGIRCVVEASAMLGNMQPHPAPGAAGDRQPSSSGKAEAEVEIDRSPSAAGRREAEPASDTSGTGDDGEPVAPRDTVALRGKARMWLAAYVASSEHRSRDAALGAMRAAHPGLGVRGSLAVWGEFAKGNPHLELSRRGAKSKRNTNN
jgi:hypothetical protein